jgi:hypothetical protein
MLTIPLQPAWPLHAATIATAAADARLPRTVAAARDKLKMFKLRRLHGSAGKIVFQSFFMLMTVQPFCFASSASAREKVPTLVSGRPRAGP